MAHRHSWRDSTGQKCPSVTTVLRDFKAPDALMYWSWRCAFEPLEQAMDILQDVAETRKVSLAKVREYLASEPLERGNFRATSQAAASAGTFAHDLVELWIKGKKRERLALARKTPAALARTYNYPEEIAEKAHSSFQAFVDWAKQYKLQVRATEEWIGIDVKEVTRYYLQESMGSEYAEKALEELSATADFSGYHGTIDCIGLLGQNKETIILDWKTSKAVYEDYLLQVAGYGLLWKMKTGEPIHSYHLVRFDKEVGDFHHHFWPELKDAEDQFLDLLRCHNRAKRIKKRCT